MLIPGRFFHSYSIHFPNTGERANYLGDASPLQFGEPVSTKASGINSESYCNGGINLTASLHLEFWIFLVKKLLKQKNIF